MAIPK